MTQPLFYTSGAEWAKAVFYLGLFCLVGIGLYQKVVLGRSTWSRWIHVAIYIHFLVGGVYSGVRMLTTDELSQMPIRRFFAWEAWFNFGCAGFYFLVHSIWGMRKSDGTPPPPERTLEPNNNFS